MYESLRRDGVRLCLSRYLISRMRAVSRFSESAVVHIAHSPAAQLCGAGTRRLFDKISAAAFFLSRRSPNENGRFPAAENLPWGKPTVGTASAVRNTISPCGRNRLLQSEAHKGFLILLAVPRSENVFDYSYLAVLLGIGMLNR